MPERAFTLFIYVLIVLVLLAAFFAVIDRI